jgi:uncharacterized radical SAM superfamily Fe-S cluster-containing enzyme
MPNDKLYSHTMALCSVCQHKVTARIIEHENKIYLEKFCPEHGTHRILTCSDATWYNEARTYVKPGQATKMLKVEAFIGCPESCGLCPMHKQHTCLPIIEIGSQCNLDCPICLKDRSKISPITSKEFAAIIDRLLAAEGTVDVINISGGEPTLYPELEALLNIASAKGITQPTVSTNGLLFLQNSKLVEMFQSTGAIVSLQFDGFTPDTYQVLRGRDLAKEKLAIIKLLETEGIRYSLTATIAKGINEHEIKAITDFFFTSKALSLNFQAATYTGNARKNLGAEHLTIPDIIKAAEQSPYIKHGDFNALPCSHFSCFAVSYYLNTAATEYVNIKDLLGKEAYLDIIANRTLPGLDLEGYGLIKEKIYELWSAADSCSTNERLLDKLSRILRELNQTGFSPRTAFTIGSREMKAVMVHQYMDVDTFDFGRIVKCCNHYPQPDGRLIPLCAQNVFFQ